MGRALQHNAGPIADAASSGGEIAHEALELHVALGEPDVARGDVGPLRVRMRLGDAQRLLVVVLGEG